MSLWTPEPTFYPSPRDAAAAPPETLAYVAAFDRSRRQAGRHRGPRRRPRSSPYGDVVGRTDMPYPGDELHHFGWNACSSALCPYAPHPHTERRYLVVPGIRSSRIMILDTEDDPRAQGREGAGGRRAGQAGRLLPATHRPLWTGRGLPVLPRRRRRQGGPGGVALLDHSSFEVLGRWELDRGPQFLAYDLWWHIAQDVAVTSEWGTPSMIEDGVVGELLLGRR